MNENLQKSINSFTIVAVTAIVAITIICLAALGFNSKISVEKEKIEVSTNSDSNQTN